MRVDKMTNQLQQALSDAQSLAVGRANSQIEPEHLLLALLDGKPLGEGVYLALITATTIGYGDLSPETWAARVVAVAIGVNGLLLTGIVVALAVKALELTYREEMERMEAAKKRRRTGGTGGGEG